MNRIIWKKFLKVHFWLQLTLADCVPVDILYSMCLKEQFLKYKKKNDQIVLVEGETSMSKNCDNNDAND